MFPEGAAARNARSRSGEGSKSSSAYANRHQQAEQRRRTRINERLDALRAITPHSERSNTATFLEECRVYVEGLQKRVAELEQQLAARPYKPAATRERAPAWRGR
ncbi:hypothetical protein WJX81_002763 [Elliptochloris bilobata]|uniref:BHLH domain-containing protein n=1 Tax=Elliptochloris bilobata TaxID=381761 RepID=A0AAW1SDX8_9CHLO